MLVIFILLVLAPLSASMQDEVLTCPQMMQTALNAADTACDGTGRNRACYGHDLLEASLLAGVERSSFDAPGDRVGVDALQSLKLLPLDMESSLWGVVLMRLQANLHAAQPEDVTLLMFGGVEVENAVPERAEVNVTITARQNANLRSEPSLQSGVIGTIRPGETAVAVERLADSSWLRVRIPGSEDEVGWVSSSLVSAASSLDALNIVARTTPYFQPMQAFYFHSDAQLPECESLPSSGLLIQTPEGVGKVRLWINEVKFQIGSTVFLQAAPQGEMLIQTLEGSAQVEALGVTHTAPAGTQIRVQMDENLRPITPPSLPEAYDANVVAQIPVNYLDEQITIAPPLTSEQVAEIIATESAADTENADGSGGSSNDCLPPCDTDSSSQNDNNSQEDDCPGNSCNAPGHNDSDDCPGNSCNAPGQNDNDDCPGNSCTAPGQGGDNPGQGGGRGRGND